MLLLSLYYLDCCVPPLMSGLLSGAVAEDPASGGRAPGHESGWGGWFSELSEVATSSVSEALSSVSEASEKLGVTEKLAQAQAAASSALSDAVSTATAPDSTGAALRDTVVEFLSMSGTPPTAEEAASEEALTALLRERGLGLVRAAESYKKQAEAAAARGREYKKQAKAAEQALVAAQQRLAEHERGGGGPAAAAARTASEAASPGGAGAPALVQLSIRATSEREVACGLDFTAG